jgi:hypothetical protein
LPPVYPKSGLALLDARVVAFSWVLLVGAITTLLLWQITAIISGAVFGFVLATFGATVVAHLILSYLHICPGCGKHPMIQGFGSIHPNAVPQSKLEGWAGVVVNVLRRRRLVCIHCGAEYAIGER